MDTFGIHDDDLMNLEPEESELFSTGEEGSVEEEPEVLSYGDTLDYTQRVRRRIINDRMAKGVPQDDDSAKLVLTALKDMDKTALDRRRNEIDSDSGETAKEVALAMREFLILQGNGNPFAVGEGGQAPAIGLEELGEYNIPEGELEQGVVEETSEEFAARMEQQLSEE